MNVERRRQIALQAKRLASLADELKGSTARTTWPENKRPVPYDRLREVLAEIDETQRYVRHLIDRLATVEGPPS